MRTTWFPDQVHWYPITISILVVLFLSHAEKGGGLSFGEGGHVDLNSNLAIRMKLFGSPRMMIAKSVAAGSSDRTIDSIRLELTRSKAAC